MISLDQFIFCLPENTQTFSLCLKIQILSPRYYNYEIYLYL